MTLRLLKDLALSLISAFTLRSKFLYITKTYNFDPLNPQFYIVKLGFKGVYIFMPRRGGYNEYP